MVILRTRNKITDFLMILAWASPFNNIDSRTENNSTYHLIFSMFNIRLVRSRLVLA